MATRGAILFAGVDRCVAGGLMRDGIVPDDQVPSWSSLMMVHGATVLADLATTKYALDNGASERNPLFGWAGTIRPWG